MKESVLDVLRYLFEHFDDGELGPDPDHDSVKSELTQAGFAESAVDKALSWLEDLAAPEPDAFVPPHGRLASVRVYTGDEQGRLDVQARGYLMALEQSGVLDPARREFVIDRIMALESEDIDLDQVRWVVRMVLHSRYTGEPSSRWLEGVSLDSAAAQLH